VTDHFEMFWSAYPRHIDKKKARLAFQRALRVTSLDTMLTALEWQRVLEGWQERDGDGVLRHVPHPATWLNGERWEDERPVRKNTSAIVPLTAGPTCGECVEGWREDALRKVYRCPCRKARSA
jgi:hypothetical protein